MVTLYFKGSWIEDCFSYFVGRRIEDEVLYPFIRFLRAYLAFGSIVRKSF